MARAYYDNKPVKTTSKKEVKRKRSIFYLVFYIVAIAAIAASYPLGNMAYNKIMESEADVQVIPEFVLRLVPKSLISGITSKIDSISLPGLDTGNEETTGQEEQPAEGTDTAAEGAADGTADPAAQSTDPAAQETTDQGAVDATAQ